MQAKRLFARQRGRVLLAGFAGLGLVLAACGGGSEGSSAPAAGATPAARATPAAAAKERVEGKVIITENPNIRNFSTSNWKTDFTRHTVPYNEITSGGPPKDGIPAIDKPKLVTLAEADKWLKDGEPVALVENKGDARAYPLQILIWHEIANDVIGGDPIVVTFCPLCNTTIAFRRTFEGQVLDFGTTGNLRFSDLVMYDRQSESWWQQATAEAIMGTHAGKMLEFFPTSVISYADFKASFPQGKVLSQDTGFARDYGSNPYTGYDDARSTPFLYDGPPIDKRLPAMERVVTVDINGEAAAYPFITLSKVRVANDKVGGQPVVVFFKPGTKSALDDISIADSRDVGAGVAFSRQVDGRVLTFKADGNRFRDQETNSTWEITGKATGGTLAGKQLEPVVHSNHFWFSWAVFRPDTRVFEG